VLAAVAEAAGVAALAEAAGAALAAVLAEPAVHRGEAAAGARPERFPLNLVNEDHHGRVRQGRPGQSVFSLQCGPHTRGGAPAHDRRVGRQSCREKQAPELDGAIPVAGEYALQKRAGVANKLRALTS
jgi:hypothetical protein